MTEDPKIAIGLPGEWALKQLLGPTFETIGKDLASLYAAGRDRILSTAHRKLRDPDDGKRTNLRVTRDVLWNGSFAEDEICAEYFGGILAASRSQDGRDDDTIQYVDVVKSLSASQLRLHYIIYHALNRLLVRSAVTMNVGMASELRHHKLWLSSAELVQLGVRLDRDLTILHRAGLIEGYETKAGNALPKDPEELAFTKINPSIFGILLFAAACNSLEEWRRFNTALMEDGSEIPVPKVIAGSFDELAKLSLGI